MNQRENYRVHCRLKELMAARGMTVDDLHRRARVSRETISQLRGNRFKGVSRNTIARICGALGVGVGELFEVLPEDIWLPIHFSREVFIHLGSRAFTEPRPTRNAGDNLISRQFLGSWDFRAFQRISEYLTDLKPGIRVRPVSHITGPGRGIDPAVRASAQQIFEHGNHVVIGSPIANQFAEEVVCQAYNVPPYSPQRRETFPYGFVWDDWRQVQSSFGWQGQRKPFGIAATPSGRIVAPHLIVPSGEGSDGALILAYRVFQVPAQREGGDDDERVIICLLGYSGPGTLAAAQLATDPDCTAGLYPMARMQPRMRAVRCTHHRQPGASPGDNRELTKIGLVPESRRPAPQTPKAGVLFRRRGVS